MKILPLYITKNILQTTGLVLLVFVGLQLLIMFIAELNYIGSGHYGLWQAVCFIILDFPEQFYQLFPMAALLGCLLGLGALASHSELIVMRASGISIGKIVQSVLVAVCVMVLVITLIGEVIAPYATRQANQYKAIALSGGQALPTIHGLWVRNQNTFIHIKDVLPGGVLHGVTRYRFDKAHHLKEASFAKTAEYKQHAWYLYQMVASFLSTQTVHAQHIAKMRWHIHLNPTLLTMSKRDPASMDLFALQHYIHYRVRNGLNANNFKLAFWQRLMQPLATLVMMLLAIPFIFGPLRNVSIGLRLMTGIMLGFSFYLVNQFFGPMSMVYQFPPFLAAILPIAVFAAVGLLFTIRKH